jgi:uncharacterized small protein (DUF1192 family)
MTVDGEWSGIEPGSELERLSALPLDERAAALAETVRRLEAELDATEATEGAGSAGPTRTGPARR